MQVRVLGDLEVRLGPSVLALGGPKPRALVGLLVAADGRPVPTERLVDQLWGAAPPPKVLTALQANVAKLRRRLEPDRAPHRPPSVLVTTPSGYRLALPESAVDAARFTALLDRAGAAGDPAAAERLLTDALGLWHGTAYAGLEDVPALAAEGRRLEELRLAAVEQLWSLRLDRGAPEEAAGALGALVAQHPSRERLWALLVLALYRSGRQADALDALRRVRAHLAEELGLDPGAELRRLEEAVLRQDDAALAPAPARPAPPSPPAPAAAPEPPPAGRAELLARTARLAAAAAAGTGRVLLVTGAPGIGKTRLAEAVARQAAAAGLRTAWGTWEEEACPPLWGWTRALGPAGRAALGAAAGVGDDPASTTFRLADAALDLLTRDGGSCLVLDDVQWADPDSLRLLGRVAGAVAAAPLLLVVTCREPLGETGPALAAALAALARAGAERMTLPGLDADAVRELVRDRTGRDVGAALAGRIRERTDGNPFYVHELVRLLAEEGALADPASPAWEQVPHGVRDTVRHRLAGLPAGVRDAVAVAAVVGRGVDLDVLEAAWDGDPAELDAALDAALAAGLVVDDREGAVRFAHALVRDAVHGELPPMARRRLHARVAAAIERCRVGHLDGSAAALAEHYRLAGPAHVRSAWTCAERAARQAAAAGAHADAAGLLTSAAGLQADDPLATPLEREALLVELGTALRRSGRIADAWAPLRSAAESALDRGDGPGAARALLVLTEHLVWSWRTAHRTDEEAVALWQRVLAALPAGEVGLRARVLAALSVEALHDPPGGRVSAWVDEALELARRDGDPAVRTDVLHVVLNVQRRPDLLPRRVPAADELVELCARRGDEPSLAVALAKRALNASALGRPDAAFADLRRALVLAERHRVAPALMVVHLGLGVQHQARGEEEASEEHLRAAERVQATLTMAGSGLATSVRATALLAQGRLAGFEPRLREVHRAHPALRDLHALSVLAADGPAAAHALLGPWREQPPMIWDYLWVSAAALRGLLWSQLGVPEAVAGLRAQLEPYADRVADGANAAFFLGSVRHALGCLALAGGDHAAARRWAGEARDLHRRLGWAPWERLSAELLARVPPG